MNKQKMVNMKKQNYIKKINKKKAKEGFRKKTKN